MFYNDEKVGNSALLCDYYELTMMNGYFKAGKHNEIAFFDVFFRKVPDDGGFAIMSGLEEIVRYIENLKFTNEELEYLRKQKIFDEDFINYLKDFSFKGDIYSVKEGTPIFPNEPVMTIKGNLIETQLIETFILTTINFSSLITTKANRIVRAADGKVVSEFGARRAHGGGAALLGSRAAYIGGVNSTSNTLADLKYNVPASGTMAHSWVQMFSSEYEAFETYCKIYKTNVTLLVDTYNVLQSGVPNAIKAFKNILLPEGISDFSIRIDSGDITYLSKKARQMLDDAGLYNCKIVASNSLDELLIRDLLLQGAKIDIFGVGERLITAKSDPVFGGVYKLAGIEKDGEIIPKIKISENISKVTTPHYKKLYRLYDNKTGKAVADYLTLHDEDVNDNEPLVIFDPEYTWKQKKLTDFTARKLHVQIFEQGKLVYKLPSIEEIRDYRKEQLDTLWDEVKRFENPHKYYVDLSEKLWNIKHEVLHKINFS